MATIDDLRKSLLEISEDQAFELIKTIRFARRAPLKKKTKKSSSKRSPKKLDVQSMLKTMNPEQRKKLIEELEGG